MMVICASRPSGRSPSSKLPTTIFPDFNLRTLPISVFGLDVVMQTKPVPIYKESLFDGLRQSHGNTTISTPRMLQAKGLSVP